MSNDAAPTVGPGGIRFYDAYLPAIEDGDFRVELSQEITPLGTGAKAETYTTSQAFSVAGPRWSLPPEDVFSVFPAANAVGIFDRSLPHVVFSRPQLPWERGVFDDGKAGGRAPWLALLVFAEGEQIGGGDALVAPPATITVGELFARAGSEILWPEITAEWYEEELLADPATVCTAIDVSPAAFAALVPAPADLRYLAHARQVDATAKDSEVLRISGDGWYSVVVAGRLPLVGTAPLKHSAHLVSLEGFEAYVGAGPSAAAPPLNSFQRVRMVALKSWSFTSVPEAGGGFAELVEGLIEDGEGGRKQMAAKLSVDVPAEADEAMEAAGATLDRGYVPLRYDTRPGERTFGWYRGPFSPVAVPRFVAADHQAGTDPVGWKPFGTASAALVYDRGYGVFDLSYAVAWETGRALALADRAFSRGLVGWRRQGHRLIDMIVERKGQVAELAHFDPDDPEAKAEGDLLEAVRANAVTEDFMKYLVGQLARELGSSPGPGRGPQPPFPVEPALPAGDPQTIAGLLTEPAMQAAVREAAGSSLEALAEWVARRYLLIGVPFEAMVADGALLPPESVRFFHLDVNWLDALVEGALSVGIESSRDLVYQDLVKDLVLDAAMEGIGDARAALLGQPPPAPPSAGDPPEMAGMLLRSALVSGWPGLEVRAYADAAASGPEIPLLRMERLSAGVMLCLWPEVPLAVTIDEPREGIAFGFEDAPHAGEHGGLHLRSLEDANYGVPTGPFLEAGAMVDANRRLVLQGAQGLLAEISARLPGKPALTPRDFAVQMIKVPERGLFAEVVAHG
jgi:hypothetical protein